MSLGADEFLDAVALVKAYQDLAGRDWHGHSRYGEERAAILKNADLVGVCDALAILAGLALDRLHIEPGEFLADLRDRLAERPE